jgi:tetratricopeptide (TPR) repeat protein
MTKGDFAALSGNTFQQTMVGLEFASRPDDQVDLFSRACVEQYRDCDLTRFGYLFAQVFEPNVLVEVALHEGVPHEQLADLSHRPTGNSAHLADLAANAADLSVVETVNVAAALISISRFEAATMVLANAFAKATGPLEHFEAWMLAFVVANRCDDADRTAQSFSRMREAMETGGVPADRGLDACAQAVVWYMKRKDLTESDFQWYLATGRRLAQRAGADPAPLSSWYRALAMVPAAEGDAKQTREYMVRARDAARDTLARRPRAFERHLLKTYLESSLKEFMYVTPDLDRAEESCRALIELDPVWAPSYGEAAEAYLRFGKPDLAAAMYDKAVAAGPHEKCGNTEQALAHYEALSRLVPDNAAVLTAGLDLARARAHSTQTHFAHLLDQLDSTKAGH